MRVYDKKGRLLEADDVLKVFHFVDRRGRRHYMYKQVQKRPDGQLYINHLMGKGGYSINFGANENGVLETTEIVQSRNWEKME